MTLQNVFMRKCPVNYAWPDTIHMKSSSWEVVQ